MVPTLVCMPNWRARRRVSRKRGWIVGSPPVRWTAPTPRRACRRKTRATRPQVTGRLSKRAMRCASEQKVQRSGQW